MRVGPSAFSGTSRWPIEPSARPSRGDFAQELAIRRSLGATRGRIIRQVLTERVVLAGFAALVAVALAFGGVGLLKAISTTYVNPRFPFAGAVLPRLDEISVDPAVLAFVVVSALVTAMLFGLCRRCGSRGTASTATRPRRSFPR